MQDTLYQRAAAAANRRNAPPCAPMLLDLADVAELKAALKLRLSPESTALLARLAAVRNTLVRMEEEQGL